MPNYSTLGNGHLSKYQVSIAASVMTSLSCAPDGQMRDFGVNVKSVSANQTFVKHIWRHLFPESSTIKSPSE